MPLDRNNNSACFGCFVFLAGLTMSIAEKFVLSAFSATVAETVTFPLDLTKTRMMLATQAGEKVRYNSAR